MDERTWKWELPIGETVVAKVDGSGTESVYLGPHLVSRSPRGAKLTGHEVRMRGPEEGTYRGKKDMRVFFDDDGCRLVVDGETIKEAAPPIAARAPPPVESRSTPRPSAPGIVLVVGLIAFIAFIVVAIRQQTRRPKDRSPGAAQTAARLPNTRTHRTTNELLTIHYPSNFHLDETSLGPVSTMVWLQADVGYEKLSFFSWRGPSTTDVWRLENMRHTVTAETWEREGDRFVGEERRSDGKCHGENAAIVVRHLVLRAGTRVRQWSCMFAHGGNAFRFVTWTLESQQPDDAYLNSLFDAAEL